MRRAIFERGLQDVNVVNDTTYGRAFERLYGVAFEVDERN